MQPAFELRQRVLERLERLGVRAYAQGPDAVELVRVPLPPGFSAPQTTLRFERSPEGFRSRVPVDLAYDGPERAISQLLSGSRSGRWRSLRLDREECRCFETALAAALTGLGSPATEALLRSAGESAAGQVEAGSPEGKSSALQRFATHLTPSIQWGRWPTIVEREEESEFIEAALLHHSPGPRVVLVVGPVGSGRWSTGAIGLGQRMVIGTARRELAGRDLYLLNPASIVGGLMMVGELEERVFEIATEVTAGGHVLFIPDSAVQVLRLLPPLHDLCVVARATEPELEVWQAAAPSQIGKATVVRLRPLTLAQTEAVLQAHVTLLRQHYRLREVSAGAVRAAADLAQEYLPQALPGAAVHLLEQGCAIASRLAQQGGEGVVQPDHILSGLRRLAGEGPAEEVLSRWFRRATAPRGKSQKGPEGPEIRTDKEAD